MSFIMGVRRLKSVSLGALDMKKCENHCSNAQINLALSVNMDHWHDIILCYVCDSRDKQSVEITPHLYALTVCVCVCVRACVRECVRACVRTHI